MSGGGDRALRRVLVLSLDGTPHSLLRRRMEARPGGVWDQLTRGSRLIRIRSSRPEVSSVAWACFQTGANPGEHGILGFVDRADDPPRLIYPNGTNLRLSSLPERVHRAGGHVISINVPTTYPPHEVRGRIVGGFLGTDLRKNVHPREWLPELIREGYVIDPDPALAHRDRSAYYDELRKALEARVRVARRALEEDDWDYAHLHIMETDRLYHFFWDEPRFARQFDDLLERVDEVVAEFREIARRSGAALVLLSDHGFTRTKRVVFMNAFLRMAGLLSFRPGRSPGFESMASSSRAWALAPGRVFINVQGREPFGSVPPGPEADALRDRVAGLMRDLKDPWDGLPVFNRVMTREELYRGPHAEGSADLVGFAREGYDLKADFGAEEVFARPQRLVGTHTYGDAFFLVEGGEQPDWLDDLADISDAGRWVVHLLNLPERNVTSALITPREA